MDKLSRLLLIDADPDHRALIRQALTQEFPDLQVREIRDAREFTTVLEAGEFDLVIMDYSLPWTNGFTVLETVKRYNPHCLVVMCVAPESEEVLIGMEKTPLDNYILKTPRHHRRLPGIVRSTWEKARRYQTLQQYERRFQLAAENIPETFVIYDTQRRFRFVNTRGIRLSGYSAQELLGHTDEELFPAEVTRGYLPALQRTLETRTPQRQEFEVTLPIGQLTMEVTYVPLLNGQGDLEEIVALTHDITQHKRTENELRQSQTRLQALFDNALDAILVADDEGRYVAVNPAACKLLGYSREEFLSLRVWDITLEPDQARGLDLWQGFLAAGEQGGEYRLRCKDGHLLEVEYRAVAHVQPGRHLSIIRDITERKRVENALRQQKELLQTIFDHIPVMVTLIAPDGRVLLTNRAWERTLGWSLEEARQIDWLAELYPDPDYRQKVLEFIRSASSQWGDFRTRVRDGRIIDTMWTNVRLSDGSNIGIGQDITARKQAERKLQQHARALDNARRQLGYLSLRVLEAQETEQRRLAHELHDQFAQSLVALKMNLDLMRKRIEHPAPKKLLEQGLDIVNQMIEQVRDLTRLLRPPLLDELGLIRALDTYVRNQMQSYGLEIHIHTEPAAFDLPPFLETVCFRIVQEALHNTIRHAKARRVDIEMRHKTTRLDIRVCDDGMGFDVQATRQRVEQGLILGLHTMQERVQLVGGTLSIHSVLSQGTEVRVCLPLRPDACHTEYPG